MEKVGLITIHDTVNFGSLLQTFSLYKALEKMGVDIELIDYKCRAIQERETTFAPREWKSWRDVIFFFLSHKQLKKKRDRYVDFLHHEMKMSPEYDINSVKETNARYSTFIDGSDIVWGMKITGGDFSYMLDFAEESKRKLAFSASVGTKWESEYEPKVKSLLSRFEFITVREHLASEWIAPLIGKGVPITCDPTMLMDRFFWQKYGEEKTKLREKYVLVYMSADNHKSVQDAIDYAGRYNFKVLFIHHGLPYRGSKRVIPTRVQEWINLIKNAEVVFTGSYHGLLFSMYLHTPVFYYNRAYSARMISLCKELGIEHREAIGNNVLEDKPIDFQLADKVMDEKRQYAFSILKDYFKKRSL